MQFDAVCSTRSSFFGSLGRNDSWVWFGVGNDAQSSQGENGLPCLEALPSERIVPKAINLHLSPTIYEIYNIDLFI